MSALTFASAYNKVAHRSSAASIVATLIPQFFDELVPLREFLTSDPMVARNVARFALSDRIWARSVASSRSHHAARSSLSAAGALAESAVARVLRPLDTHKLALVPVTFRGAPGGRPDTDAVLKARAVTAWVAKLQLAEFDSDRPNTYPHISMKNAGEAFLATPKAVREWFRFAVMFGMLHEQDAPRPRQAAHYGVKLLTKKQRATLTPDERAIAAALTPGEVVPEHPAAMLLFSVDHEAWWQKRRSLSGAQDWWAALQVAANRPTDEVSEADERRAAQLAIRGVADIDALVTPEGRARQEAYEAARAIEREESTAYFRDLREKNAATWSIIRERLDWTECTDETLLDWTHEALARLSAANERAWASGDGPGADARAVAVRDSLTWRIRDKFKLAPDLRDALRALHVSALTRAERNLRDVLGWGTVSADQLVEKAQETVLRLVSAPDDLAADIRRTLIGAIPRRYPHDASAVAEALTILKGAA